LEDFDNEARAVETAWVISGPKIEMPYPFLEIENGAITKKRMILKIQVWFGCHPVNKYKELLSGLQEIL